MARLSRLLPPVWVMLLTTATLAVAVGVVAAEREGVGPFVVGAVQVASDGPDPLVRITDDEVRAAAAIAPSTPWWSVPWGEVDLPDPRVATARVVPTVSGAAIVVVEAEPVLALVDSVTGRRWVVTADGTVIGPQTDPDADLPVVDHAAATWARPGDQAHADIAGIARTVAALPPDLVARARTVATDDFGGTVLHVDGVTVLLGDDRQIAEKAAAATTVLAASPPGGVTVDVRAPSAPTISGIDPTLVVPGR